MTETELIDRLREAIVLDGPDVWRTNGYLQDAQQVGIPLADALKRATEISQEVANNSILFQNIQARIVRLAEPSRSHLVNQDLAQIVNAATSLKLSADFVRNRWVPTVLKRIAPPPVKPAEPVVPVTTSPPVAVVPPPAPSNTYEDLLEDEADAKKSTVPVVTSRPIEPQSAPTNTSTESFFDAIEQQKIDQQKKAQSQPEMPPVVRSFTATPARIRKGQTVTLAWEVENLLAVTIDDLGEGLSPSNRGWVKPSKSTDYTLFDVNNNPLSTVRVDVIQPDRSGIYGILFALALLAIIYWFIKNSESNDTPAEPKKKTEQTSGAFLEKKSRQESATEEPEKKPEVTDEATDTSDPALNTPPSVAADKQPKTVVEETPRNAPPNLADEKPTTAANARQGKYQEVFGDKPYDKVELGTDERGWRRARSNGRWGFVDEADEWVINPDYEAVTPFRDNQAKVFLNGETLVINRSGIVVKN
ncbi:WG repeat-containing protein [Spirosoma sp. BT702]|uniref:WG repeat-containing protein n=1 Tax=Spirosoma profusum TaxID=2771354 RepID=A0A926Y1V1_9BACT|nr:WG repeat-containing protein [Spirosoma profusum]MBD2704485.1 WG repeat-containing protein [Spirosoma profusum]